MTRTRNRNSSSSIILMTAIGIAFILFVALGATKIPQGKCSAPVIVEASHDVYYEVGYRSTGMPVSIYYEPDASAVTDVETGQISLQACTQELAVTCSDLQFDSTGSGTPDTNILDGLSMPTSGVVGINGFPYLRVQEVEPSTDDEYVICRGF